MAGQRFAAILIMGGIGVASYTFALVVNAVEVLMHLGAEAAALERIAKFAHGPVDGRLVHAGIRSVGMHKDRDLPALRSSADRQQRLGGHRC